MANMMNRGSKRVSNPLSRRSTNGTAIPDSVKAFLCFALLVLMLLVSAVFLVGISTNKSQDGGRPLRTSPQRTAHGVLRTNQQQQQEQQQDGKKVAFVPRPDVPKKIPATEPVPDLHRLVPVPEPIVVEEEVPERRLVLTTPYGDVRVDFRPDLSPESVAYVRTLVTALHARGRTTSCDRCTFHRAERNLLLQGVLTSDDIVDRNTVFGRCVPPDDGHHDNEADQRKCPPHDPQCGCHGPVMTKGMVAWAAGSAGGPDFFVNTFHRPVDWWDHQHTVWGEVTDDASFAVLDRIYALPVTNTGGLHMLREKIRFGLELEDVVG